MNKVKLTVNMIEEKVEKDGEYIFIAPMTEKAYAVRVANILRKKGYKCETYKHTDFFGNIITK